MPFVVREPRPEEVPELIALLTRAMAESLRAIPLEPQDADSVAQSTLGDVLPKMAANYKEGLIMLIAEDTDTGVIAGGSAAYVSVPERVCHGMFVWVRPEYRGRSLFTRTMFRNSEQAALKLGANRLEIAVMEHDPRTRRLYERLGYKPYAVNLSKRLK